MPGPFVDPSQIFVIRNGHPLRIWIQPSDHESEHEGNASPHIDPLEPNNPSAQRATRLRRVLEERGAKLVTKAEDAHFLFIDSTRPSSSSSDSTDSDSSQPSAPNLGLLQTARQHAKVAISPDWAFASLSAYEKANADRPGTERKKIWLLPWWRYALFVPDKRSNEGRDAYERRIIEEHVKSTPSLAEFVLAAQLAFKFPYIPLSELQKRVVPIQSQIMSSLPVAPDPKELPPPPNPRNTLSPRDSDDDDIFERYYERLQVYGLSPDICAPFIASKNPPDIDPGHHDAIHDAIQEGVCNPLFKDLKLELRFRPLYESVVRVLLERFNGLYLEDEIREWFWIHRSQWRDMVREARNRAIESAPLESSAIRKSLAQRRERRLRVHNVLPSNSNDSSEEESETSSTESSHQESAQAIEEGGRNKPQKIPRGPGPAFLQGKRKFERWSQQEDEVLYRLSRQIQKGHQSRSRWPLNVSQLARLVAAEAQINRGLEAIKRHIYQHRAELLQTSREQEEAQEAEESMVSDSEPEVPEPNLVHFTDARRTVHRASAERDGVVEETDSELEMEIELRRDMRTLSMGERAPNRSPSRLALEFPLSSHQSGRRTRDPSSDKSRSSSSASQSDNPVPRQGRMIQGTRGDVRDKARGEVPEGRSTGRTSTKQRIAITSTRSDAVGPPTARHNIRDLHLKGKGKEKAPSVSRYERNESLPSSPRRFYKSTNKGWKSIFEDFPEGDPNDIVDDVDEHEDAASYQCEESDPSHSESETESRSDDNSSSDEVVPPIRPSKSYQSQGSEGHPSGTGADSSENEEANHAGNVNHHMEVDDESFDNGDNASDSSSNPTTSKGTPPPSQVRRQLNHGSGLTARPTKTTEADTGAHRNQHKSQASRERARGAASGSGGPRAPRRSRPDTRENEPGPSRQRNYTRQYFSSKGKQGPYVDIPAPIPPGASRRNRQGAPMRVVDRNVQDGRNSVPSRSQKQSGVRRRSYARSWRAPSPSEIIVISSDSDESIHQFAPPSKKARRHANPETIVLDSSG